MRRAALLPLIIIACTAALPFKTAAEIDGAANHSATRLRGLNVGPHRVGFLSRTLVDPTRHTSRTDQGTRLGVAVWYPAAAARGASAMTGLDYRLLAFQQPLNDAERQRFAAGEAETAMAWRHVGIVPMDRAQAAASLDAPGIAVRNAAPVSGRFPVVMVLGGQYYLSTTAELLASHGFVVAAAFRYTDVANEVGTASFTWYLENSVRDAEWVVDHLRTFESADVSRLGAIGHGGGGLQALLFAMRNTNVTALVNVDAGNFSARTHSQPIPFYSPRLLRVPYLYVATAEAKAGQDRWDDFLGMRFSDRVDVTLHDAALRHHDLSDLGRAVTAPMGIRGDSQAVVERAYADVQEMMVRFFTARAGGRSTREVADWLTSKAHAGALTVAVHPGVPAAPTVETVLASLDASTAAILENARAGDPEAPVFRADALNRIVAKALANREFAAAASIAAFALRLHPDSVPLLDSASEAHEGRGDRAGAADLAAKCTAAPPGTDWRTSVALSRCRERLARLRDD